MADELMPCPFCGGEADVHYFAHDDSECTVMCSNPNCRASVSARSCGSMTTAYNRARKLWNRRAERTWHDFSDELPPAGASVLCRGRNGALYVGKPVTVKGNGTRRVWVPRGDQYRTPEKWMEIEDAD